MKLTTWNTRDPKELQRQLAELERRFELFQQHTPSGRATRGALWFYGAAGWESLSAGVAGQYLQTQGATLDPVWATVSGGGGGVSDGAYGDITVSGGGTVWSFTPGVITPADFANAAPLKLFGNPVGSPGVPQFFSLGASLSFDTGPIVVRAALTGDVTAAANSNATTIATAAVGNSKLANMAANTIKGNNTGGANAPVDLTVAQVKTLLAYTTGDIGATFLDSVFRIQDNADTTKQLAFEVSGLTTATTRTIDAANADIDLTGAQSVVLEDFAGNARSATASTDGARIDGVTFTNTLVGTWSNVNTSLNTNHPGILRLGLPATIGAVAGIVFGPHQSGGGDLFICTFRTPSAAFTNLTIKLGQFQGNTSTTSEPTDGVYLWQTAGTSTFGFKSANASTRTTGATAALSVATWYTAIIRWDTARTQADCFLYNDASALIVSANLSTNLPTTSVVLYGQASVSTSAAAAKADALDIDRIGMRWGSRGRKLTRPTPNLVQEFMQL